MFYIQEQKFIKTILYLRNPQEILQLTQNQDMELQQEDCLLQIVRVIQSMILQ
jgi:hypothetical protein